MSSGECVLRFSRPNSQKPKSRMGKCKNTAPKQALKITGDPAAEIRFVEEEENRSRVMGIITSSFPFIVGTVCGIYIAQNYDVPNIKRVFNDAIFRAKQIEERYRKPRKGD